MKEVRVGSWCELQERLFEGSWDERIGRFRSPFVFRGMSDSACQLRTRLIRIGGAFRSLEHHILRNFIKYASRDPRKEYSIWHWMTIAQHHGLPTRLLDWTYSPFVAVHFATDRLEKFDRDGVIWKVDFHGIHARLPPRLRTPLTAEGANAFTITMLADLTTRLPDFDLMAREDFLLFFEPPSLDDRIVNQFALFSVASNAEAPVDCLLERHADLCHKILIPAELKWEVRDKLDQANVTERVLFPGMDGLAQWLTRHYSPNRDHVPPPPAAKYAKNEDKSQEAGGMNHGSPVTSSLRRGAR